MVHSDEALAPGKGGKSTNIARLRQGARVPSAPLSWWDYWLKHNLVTVITMTLTVPRPEVRHHYRDPGRDSLVFALEG